MDTSDLKKPTYCVPKAKSFCSFTSRTLGLSIRNSLFQTVKEEAPTKVTLIYSIHLGKKYHILCILKL